MIFDNRNTPQADQRFQLIGTIFLEMARKRHRAMTTKTKSTKRVANTKTASKKARKPVGCKPRSSAEQKLVDAGKADSKHMVRWMPESFGNTFKSLAFEAWLKRPAEPSLATELAERFGGKISVNTLRKWLSNFAGGCNRAGARYPRIASGRAAEIQKALAKIGNGAKLSAETKKRLAS
jgi:hypothetical protein